MRWLLSFCTIGLLSISNVGHGESLRGFAEIHNHQFANHAFGGLIVFGDAYGPIDEALSTAGDIIRHGPFHRGDYVGGVMSARGLVQLQEGFTRLTLA